MIVAVADTHAAIWHLYADRRLSLTAKTFIERAAAIGVRIGISSITLAETLYLEEKGAGEYFAQVVGIAPHTQWGLCGDTARQGRRREDGDNQPQPGTRSAGPGGRGYGVALWSAGHKSRPQDSGGRIGNRLVNNTVPGTTSTIMPSTEAFEGEGGVLSTGTLLKTNGLNESQPISLVFSIR
jgi:hypothetical protein